MFMKGSARFFSHIPEKRIDRNDGMGSAVSGDGPGSDGSSGLSAVQATSCFFRSSSGLRKEP